jgi:outer membrane receptor protein involved in Fe transport
MVAPRLMAAAGRDPADPRIIEQIEVITNPSAKFKPDGTSGIINLVLKAPNGLSVR